MNCGELGRNGGVMERNGCKTAGLVLVAAWAETKVG